MNEQGIRFAISADDRATRVFAGVRKELQSVQGAAGSLRASLSTFAPTVAAAFSLAAITAFVRNTVNGIDALNDLADATGSSVENLSALEDVAARTGTSMETVGGAVIKLNKSLSDAKPGSDAARALEAIGLSAKELKALDPAEALLRTAVALSGFADDGNKARLTQELFGKSLREVAPLLNDLARAGQLNATVTTEQAQQAERFNQELAKLAKNSADVARALTGALLPSLNEVFARIEAGRGVFGSLPAAIKASLSKETFADAGAGVARYTKEVERLQRVREIVSSKGGRDPFRGDLESINEQLVAAQKLQAFYRSVFARTAADNGQSDPRELARRGRLPSGAQSLPDIGGGAGGGKAAAERIKNVAPIIDPASIDALRALEGTDLGKIARLNAQLTELFTLQRETRGAPAVAEAIAKTREELAKLDPAAVAAAESAKRLQEILAQTPSGKLTAVLVDVKLVNKAFDEGKLNAEQWAAAIRAVTANLSSDGQDEIEKLSSFAEQAARNIQDALGTTLESALRGNFDGIGQMWGNLLIRMAAQAAATRLNDFLFGSTLGGGGAGTGVLGAFLGLSGTRANGGPVSAGGAYLVGERGPEIMVPRSAGTVLPNGTGMGVTINQTINVGQGVSRGEVFAAAMQAKDAAKAEIMQTLVRTGRGAYA